MNKKKNIIYMVCTYAILIFALIITVFPLFYTISASFKTNIEILTEPARILPKNPTIENYVQAWNADDFNVPVMLKNSLYYTVINVFISIFSSAMAGYAFARGEFVGKKIIFAMFTALMFIRTGGLEIYPKFEILNTLNIDTGLNALIFLHLFGVPVINIYLVRGFVNAIPKDLDEAAKIDGCGFIGTFFKVIAPLLKPVLATIGILAFQGSWNEYLMPTVFTVNNPEQRTLIVGLMALKSSTGAATNWNLMLAGSVIALVPVLFAYGVGNKYFVSGLSAGAVKG